MLDPYRMILVNIICAILLLLGIIIYKFIYPKRSLNLLLILILISLLPLISILRKGTYQSGDLNIHVEFAMSFFGSLKEGNLVPRWSSQMIYGYGYPLFLFTYPLPYYLAGLLHFIGFTFINSLKIILAFSFIASGITMYFFIKEELKNKYSAFVAALFYLFAPYHLVDLHFRVAVGEIVSFAILPFCFLSIKKMSTRVSFLWFFFSAISFTLLILSHQAISLISIPFIIIYFLYLFLNKNKKSLIYILSCIFSLIMGILLSCFYWLPVIFEAKYTNLLTKGTILFIQLNQLIYSPWRWGFLFQGSKGEISLIIGYLQWFAVLFSIFLFFIKTNIKLTKKNFYLISLGSFVVLLFLTQSFSSFVWVSVPLLKGFQFSSRLLLLISFFTSVIAGIVIKNIPNKIFLIVLCFLTISTTMLNWGNRKTILLTDSYIFQELPYNMSKVGPGTTIWVNSDKFDLDQKLVPHIAILSGNANILELSRTSVKHVYLINVTSENAIIKENTLYFPGWIVKTNNKVISINYQNSKSPGIINFNLIKGTNKVILEFVDTPIIVFSKWISLLSLFGILIYFLSKLKK